LAEESYKELTIKAAGLRKYILTMNCYAGSGHPGGSLSAAEIVTYLFHKEINFSSKNSKDINRDRFVLSKGHSCLVLYAALAQKGFFSVEEFKKLRHVGGMLQGHPDRLKTPGLILGLLDRVFHLHWVAPSEANAQRKILGHMFYLVTANSMRARYGKE